MTTNEKYIEWTMKGRGYEFCNCDFGCGCNFGGFPNSEDGSCNALVGLDIDTGSIGDVKVGGLKCAALVAWPKAIHEGNGKCVFVVEPSMLLLFVAGVMNLLAVALIAVFVLLEKLVPRGEWVARASGVLLIMAGLGVIATSG